MARPSCHDCSLFVHAPQALERAVPGLNILSSAFGSVRADTGLCAATETFVTRRQACDRFQPTAHSAQTSLGQDGIR